MDPNNIMDDPTELAALEERLYSNFHHSYEAPSNTEGTPVPVAAAAPTRVVTNTSVVNNADSAILKSKMKRYWATTEGMPRAPNPNQPKFSNSFPKQLAYSKPTQPASESKEKGVSEPNRMFSTPYQSLLGNVGPNGDGKRAPTLTESNITKVTDEVPDSKRDKEAIEPKPAEKIQKKVSKTNQAAQLPIKKKLASLMKLVHKGPNQNRKQQWEAKQAKASMARQRNAKRIVAQINLDSSDEESRPQQPTVPTRAIPISDEHLDDEADEVVLIPAPEPPKIFIDCSDDEDAQDSFAFPHAKKSVKKVVVSKFASPRCLSPSNSSIMSDDFIGQLERSRLNDSFGESIPNDDELECPIECQRRAEANKGKKGAVPARDQRAPSISSEETVCNSSDTTDQEKRRLEANSKNTPKSLSPALREADSSSSKSKKDETKKSKGSKQNQAAPSLEQTSGEPTVNGSAKKVSSADVVGTKQPVGAKAKTKCKSPVSMALDLARKQFEVQGSGSDAPVGVSAKKKSKKDQASEPNRSPKTSGKKSASKASNRVSDSDSLYKLLAERTAKTRTDHCPISYDDDSVSSESDYELGLVAPGASARTKRKRQPEIELPALDQLDDISSESDYGENFAQAHKSTPKVAKEASKRAGRKRKQYNSENYSDEDFACMLTDIVRAVSDTDDDEEEEEAMQRAEEEIHPPEPLADDVGASSTAVEATASGKQDSAKTKRVRSPSTKKKKRTQDASFVAANDDSLNISGIEVPIEILDDRTGNEMEAPPLSATSNQDNSTVTSVPPEGAWNDEMKRFYNNDWMEDGFSLSSVFKSMPRAKKHWQLVQKDRYPDPPKKEVTCNNCGERGHMRYKCRNAPKPSICYMCGEQGHREPRCPRTICLNCGGRTRNFMRGCNDCIRELKSTCRLCGVRGHTQRTCPDLWRRYHNTIEDNVPLKNQYQVNTSPKYCCICCKKGHQAHMCTTAYRIFGHAIPTIHIQSYQAAYRGTQEEVSGPRYSLLSDEANESELNLHHLAANPNGFYYRFAKSTGLLEKYEQRMKEEEALNEQCSSRQPQQQQQQQPEQSEHDQNGKASSPAADTVEPAPSLKATKLPKKKKDTDMALLEPVSATEDSNYSFSGLLTAEEEECVQRTDVHEIRTQNGVQPSDESGMIEVAPDFIPFTSEAKELPLAQPPAPAAAEQCSDGKVFLGKPHAKLLLSSKGSEFLNEAAKRHGLVLSISFESVGNMLTMVGHSDAQDRFHRELVTFLNSNAPEVVAANALLNATNPVPRVQRKAVEYIFSKLQLLGKPYRSVKDLYKSYQLITGVRNTQAKQVEKLRCTLNTVLFGQFGLRDGRKHLNVLQAKMADLIKAPSPGEKMKGSDRDEIAQSVQYLFSGYDHGDYRQIYREFEELDRTHKLRKIKLSDLNLPCLSGDGGAPKAGHTPATHGGNEAGQFNVNRSLCFENTSAVCTKEGADTAVRGAGRTCQTEDGSAVGWFSFSPPNSPARAHSRAGGECARGHRDDLILNTSDQVSYSDRLNCLDHATRAFEDEQSVRRMTFACGVEQVSYGGDAAAEDSFQHPFVPRPASRKLGVLSRRLKQKSDMLFATCWALAKGAKNPGKKQALALKRLKGLQVAEGQRNSGVLCTKQIRELSGIRNTLSYCK